MKKTINDIDLYHKRVLLRADFNVPLTKERVADDSRIRKTLPTIRKLIEQRSKVIVCSHLGRPKGKPVDALRLDPVAERLSELLNMPVPKIDETVGTRVSEAVEKIGWGEVVMVENTRFDPGEKKNDEKFARKLADLADVYVDDAFAASHRAHASTEKVAHYLPAVAGLLMAEEINTLGKVLEHPAPPLVFILGGAKVSDKIQVIERMLSKADSLLIGGGMANTFLKARGNRIGNSKVEAEQLETAGSILKKYWKQIFLPQDVVVAEKFEADASIQTVEVEHIPDGWQIMDIGPDTTSLYIDKIYDAQTVVWNGPLGVYEMAPFAKATDRIAEALSETDAVTVAGGGDLGAAIAKTGLENKLTHVSTGGGAFLDFLAGKALPGVSVLMDKSMP